jgi:uncharacterized protein YuzE
MDNMQQSHRIAFNVAWDEGVDVAYLSPADESSVREVAKTVPIIDRAQQLYGTLDLSGDGKLLGIEILGARRMLSDLTDKSQGSDNSDK